MNLRVWIQVDVGPHHGGDGGLDGQEETSLPVREYVSDTAIPKIIRRTHVYGRIVHSAAVFDMKLLIVLVRIPLVYRPESSTVIRGLTGHDVRLL